MLCNMISKKRLLPRTLSEIYMDNTVLLIRVLFLVVCEIFANFMARKACEVYETIYYICSRSDVYDR